MREALEARRVRPKKVHLSSSRRNEERHAISCGSGPRVRGPRLTAGARARARNVTIVLAEEQHLVRRGVRCLLEKESAFMIVGETGDGLEAVKLVQRRRPRILVIGVALPGLNGLDVARQVHDRFPATAVVMLSMYSKEQYVARALQNGASGYVLKAANPSELVRAIRHAAVGQQYLSEPLSEESIRERLRRAKTDGPTDLYETLSDREREVLQLVAEGYTSTRIAARLHISPRTVETHRASVMRKMGFSNLVDVILFAVSRNILPRALGDIRL